jgi:hypothetical protein
MTDDDQDDILFDWRLAKKAAQCVSQRAATAPAVAIGGGHRTAPSRVRPAEKVIT